MMSRNTLLGGIIVAVTLISVSAHSAWWKLSKDDEETAAEINATEIGWEDLIPDDWTPPVNPYVEMSQQEIDKLMDGSDESNAEVARINELLAEAPVNSGIDGQLVKIPAYITPLEFDGSSLIKEFLLVPYVGACIHVPPPPANQIVLAESPEAIEFAGMYDPVWAIGTIRTEETSTELAETGYRLEVEKVVPYTQR